MTKSDESSFGDVIARLTAAGIAFDTGLTASELANAEARYGVRFPPDLACFLTLALPRGERFPDWRSADEETIRDRLEAPLEGILFDVQRSNFWWPAWGDQPTVMADALTVATAWMKEAPRLIPIYGHRYIPELPTAEGNPIFSVVQTDVIHYGVSLLDYLESEFLNPHRVTRAEHCSRIDFWSELVDWNSRRS